MLRAAWLLLPLLAGCTMAQVNVGLDACPGGTATATIAEAFFGRNVAGREAVTDAEWARFLDEVVTPALPDGLTVMHASGQWRGRDGGIERERTLILLLVLPGAAAEAARDRMAPVIAAYRQRFAQEAVMLTLRAGCVGF